MKKISYSILLIVVYCIAFSNNSFAQNLKTYSGKMTGYSGKATYTYYENKEKERIYHGKFSVVGNNGATYTKGNYSHGMKNGTWLTKDIDNKKYQDEVYGYTLAKAIAIEQFGYLGVEALKKIKAPQKNDYEYTETKNFRNDTLNGEYSYKCKNFALKTYFNKGILSNNFFYVDNEKKIQGEVGLDGFATGEWTLKFKNEQGVTIIQKDYYNHGILYKSCTFDESIGKTDCKDIDNKSTIREKNYREMDLNGTVIVYPIIEVEYDSFEDENNNNNDYEI